MKKPRKAVILSAGFGTRMQPLTLSVPKPLLLLQGVPVLERQIALLEKWGVRDIVVNLHHRADAIVSYIRARKTTSASISLSMEPTILDTGGAIKKADWFLDEEPFWIINSDIMAILSPRSLLQLYEEENPLAVLWMTSKAGPRTVAMSGNRVINFRSPAPGSPITSTFCGLHLVSPQILSFIPLGIPCSIIDAYSHAMTMGHQVLGKEVARSTWMDLGTPESYMEAHKYVSARDRTSSGRWISPGARAARTAVINNSVVYDNADIGPWARLHNAIVAPGTRLNTRCDYIAMPAADIRNTTLNNALARIGWSVDRTTAIQMRPRGSDRSFVRLVSGHKRMMMVSYGLERPENAYHARNSIFLGKTGIRVPAIYFNDDDNRLILMEDLGDLDLKQAISDQPESTSQFYRRILDRVHLLHSKGTKRASRTNLELPPPFTAALYRWEHDLFITHHFTGSRYASASTVKSLKADLERLGSAMTRLPRVLIHRDLQSSNILFHKGSFAFIDFQGMRMGAAEYDIASLLSDPYVSLAEETQLELLDYYSQLSGESFNSLQNRFWKASAQRLVQALGAYGRLSALPCLSRFKVYIKPALLMLSRALNNLEDYPVLRHNIDDEFKSTGKG